MSCPEDSLSMPIKRLVLVSDPYTHEYPEVHFNARGYVENGFFTVITKSQNGYKYKYSIPISQIRYIEWEVKHEN